MARSVRLEVLTQEVENIHAFGVYRVILRAYSATEMPNAIFVFRKEPLDDSIAQVVDTCMGVCSPVDISEYPINAPDPDKSFPFFRKDVAIYDFRSATHARAAIDEIKAQIAVLIDGLNATDSLLVSEDVLIGG